jgi:hypothetical protein
MAVHPRSVPKQRQDALEGALDRACVHPDPALGQPRTNIGGAQPTPDVPAARQHQQLSWNPLA